MKKILLSAVLIFLILAIFVFSKNYSSAAITVLKVGKISDYSPGTIKFISKAKAFVISDGEGIYAISAVCTHLGCIVSQKANNIFACPCHGANFDLIGKVLKGPAKRDLAWYHLEIDKDNNIILDSTTAVSEGTKLMHIKE